MLGLGVFCVFLTATAAAISIQPKFLKINTESFGNSLNHPFNIKPRISNGDRARVGDFPWHALLVVKYRGNTSPDPTFCSGAILNEEWIITSAECISKANTVRVDVGSVDINKPLVSVYPDALTLHPEYDVEKRKNNIALLRLKGDDKLNFEKDEYRGKIGPIRLPSRRQVDENFEGFEAFLAGFGKSSPADKNVSQRLLFTEQRTIPNSACIGYYGNDPEMISSKMICSTSTEMKKAACEGDSGAPLNVMEYGSSTLIGLLSFVHKDGSCGRQPVPAAFTRIASYFDWINRITGYQIRP